MTPDEVQRALNYPTLAADLASVCSEKCDEGAALQLDDFELDDRHFIVRFWFTKQDIRLHIVSMYAKPPASGSGAGSFAQIKAYLQKIYGPARSISMDRGHFVVTWALTSTTITLYSDGSNDMSIVYQEKPSGEAGKS